ncbi:MAG: bifunctional methylenetetrahydrofolate dehydrogenase/methenyltetrahydrofolate cyclohydrolase FolD [Firmicutes bacterium]|nr:bifunctional methylenetetrahydrofolate dehydrogenase/methenyltetrahydrofolate cyclohydrolase FolD [Bacillota bacterium]
MSAKIIDGKAVSDSIRAELRAEVARMKGTKGLVPGLAVIIVGNDPASRVYVDSKKRACAEIGIYSEEHALPEKTTQAELLNLIRKLNNDPKIHGILCQVPLPKHLDEKEVLNAIDPRKDVDGFHPVNVGKMMVGEKAFLPCTPHGVMELIKRTGIALQGKQAVVVGRSNIVGKPVAIMLLSENATVTICHSRTADLPGECRKADVLVVAVGKKEMVKGGWIKPGAVVIDVGVNREEGSKKLYGDVEYEAAKEVAGYITPVPGGVGPMTIAMLMKNTVEAANMGR